MSHYFDFLEADARDKQLTVAKKLGIVPEGCLLNGSLVMGLHYTTPDNPPENYICSLCRDGPRDRCGGAPYKEPEHKKPELSSRDRANVTNDDAGFRGLERRRVVDILNSLVE